MRAATKDSSSAMLIDLKAYHTFAEIKHGLESKLDSMQNVPIGSKINIDIGNKILSNKQIRQMEDIVLEHGMHLQDFMANGSPDFLEVIENDEPIIEGMPYYSETSLLCQHIRSGQKHFTEGNIVVLGDINPGAEVIAGGNILVMGSLRGMAHAGVFGDEAAVIAAYRLKPIQLRIASHITRPPDGEKYLIDYPEVARIREGRVVIEKLKI